MKTKQYKPRKGSFPYKTLEYLYENGESKNEDIRREIGLNEWSDKHSYYSDRSSYHFSRIVSRLMKEHGLIVRTKHGWYTLTPSNT